MKRRLFLAAATGAASAAPLVLRAAVRGVPPPSERITLGMIGCGRQAVSPNLEQLLELRDVQVVAVCDVDAWRLEEARRRVDAYYAERAGQGFHRSCARYGDFRELLARPDIDAVMISTPDHWHVPMGILAARAGKHVSIEKPLSISIADGRALCRAVAETGVVSRTDSEFRSLPSFRRAAALVRAGRIGKLLRISTGAPPETEPVPPQPSMEVPEGLDYEMWLGPAPEAPYTEKRVHAPHDLRSRPNWMRISDYTNGMIANWGAHLNDIAQWGGGSELTGPVEVAGEGEFSKGLWNTITRFDVRYRYASGVELRYALGRPHVRFEGTDGWVDAEYPDTLTASTPALLSEDLRDDDATRAALRSDKQDFVHAIKTGRPTLEPVEVGHRVASICQLGLIAVVLGTKLRFDPDRETFPDDNAACAMLTVPKRPPWNVS